jgi:hypothetical protein
MHAQIQINIITEQEMNLVLLSIYQRKKLFIYKTHN